MERIQRALERARASAGEAAVSIAEARPSAPGNPNERGIHLEGLAHKTAQASAPIQRLALDRGALRPQRVVLADETNAAAHAYRMLRAQVLQRARAKRSRVFGVVSAARGEGKTLTAVNLAISMAAEPNQSVSLIDLDLRRPMVAQTLGIAPMCGLDSWLAADTSAVEVCCEIEEIPRMRIVPTLAPVSGSSEAIAGPRTRELFEELKRLDEQGLLIVDLPPALLTDDVLTVAPLVDGFILVITEGRTLRDDVGRVLELLGRDRIVGTVLNGSLSSERRAY